MDLREHRQWCGGTGRTVFKIQPYYLPVMEFHLPKLMISLCRIKMRKLLRLWGGFRGSQLAAVLLVSSQCFHYRRAVGSREVVPQQRVRETLKISVISGIGRMLVQKGGT